MAGSIILSCGHRLAEDEKEVDVRWKDVTCDAVTGFSNVVAFGTFCPGCADEWHKRGALIETDAQELEWLNGTPTE